MRIAALVLIAAGCVCFFLASYRRQHLKRHSALEASALEAFTRIYSNFNPQPTLKVGYAYGFPKFTITFETKALRDEREKSGSNSSFVNAIAHMCANEGTRARPFEAARAIHFTYASELEDVMVKLRAIHANEA